MTKKVGQIEVIVRGVWRKEGRILLCRNRGATYCYLPGGHVEFGEGAEAALRRELQEEMGGRFCILRFLGVDEEVFVQNGKPHAELNLVFEVRGPGKWGYPSLPLARESHLEFFWVPLDALQKNRFLPPKLGRILLDWLDSPMVGWSGIVKLPKY